ncbi:MAG: hypothetical protein PHN55_06505 [Dysgonamonadaceae bacterium]|nr:hypothetical protein [Dysgonamonadaceae bacterium]
MDKLIEKFVKKEGKNLLLIDMPTGTGKSTKVMDFISKYIHSEKNPKKILYITGLKKNLNEVEFKKRLKDDVLFLNNNTDTLIENYKKVNDSISLSIKENPITKKLERLLKVFEGVASNDVRQETRNIIESEIERGFRGLIENEISVNKSTGKKRTLQEKKS